MIRIVTDSAADMEKEELEKYIKENNVCFDDAQQMLKLCIYADSLLK